MNRLKTVKDLIRQDKFDIAEKILVNDTTGPESLRVLSLLYRYQDVYDLECITIEKALGINPDDAYMQERMAWYNLSPFEKHEARPPLALPDNPEFIPQQKTLDQLCFVTGGDSNYFEYIVECIESIKNEKRYHNANICVIDTGLTTEEVQYLHSKLNVTKVVDPGWNLPFTTMNFKTPDGSVDIKRTKEEARCYQFIMNAVFAQETFPEYEYFFVIQPDLWIHDSRFLDQMICIAERKEMCRVCMNLSHPLLIKGHFLPAQSIPIPKEAYLYTQTKHFPISGISCMNKATSKKNAAYYKHFVSNHGLWLGYEEISATVLLNKRAKPEENILPNRHCYSVSDFFEEMCCLRENHKVIVGAKGDLYDFVPLTTNNQTHATGENKKDRAHNNFYKKLRVFDTNDKHILSPVRFRCHIWRDKEEIKNMILQEKEDLE